MKQFLYSPLRLTLALLLDWVIVITLIMASLFAFTSGIFKNNSYSDVLEINDTEIFGVNMRIFKPVIKTSKSVGNIADEERLLPGVIYFHGGGWTVGTLGKSSDKVKTLMSNGFICKRKRRANSSPTSA